MPNWSDHVRSRRPDHTSDQGGQITHQIRVIWLKAGTSTKSLFAMPTTTHIYAHTCMKPKASTRKGIEGHKDEEVVTDSQNS